MQSGGCSGRKGDLGVPGPVQGLQTIKKHGSMPAAAVRRLSPQRPVRRSGGARYVLAGQNKCGHRCPWEGCWLMYAHSTAAAACTISLHLAATCSSSPVLAAGSCKSRTAWPAKLRLYGWLPAPCRRPASDPHLGSAEVMSPCSNSWTPSLYSACRAEGTILRATSCKTRHD